MNRSGFLIIPLVILLAAAQSSRLEGQGGTPTATLVSGPTVTLAGAVDSNSPAIWEMVGGRPFLHVLTSSDGQPTVAWGQQLTRLGAPRVVSFTSHPGHGVWMEAIVTDEAGTWYGFYHNEIPAELCGRPSRVLPRIGAARSIDRGRSWEDLGIVLEAPPEAHDCGTPNRYFVGGVGDLSVMLDDDSTTLYFFFSQYSRSAARQGVAAGRMLWADRDRPAGRVEVWAHGVWLPADTVTEDEAEPSAVTWQYPAGTPLVVPSRPWHDADPVNDVFWGPSVHWNTHLRQYVMLLNRAKDESWSQEGVYVSFSPVLDDPLRWTTPQRLVAGGTWYPQVMGLETGSGTDKSAGARARFFVGGTSTQYVDFGFR